MKVKILQNFDYSLDGIRPTSFKEGDVTDKFNPEIAKQLMDRGWVGVKGSKTVSQKTPEELEEGELAAKKIKEEKDNAEKFETRKAEAIKSGVSFKDGTFSYLDVEFPQEELLTASDEEWKEFIEGVVSAIDDSKNSESDEDLDETDNEIENSDDSFDEDDDLESESEKNENSPQNSNKQNKKNKKNKNK